MKRSIFKIKEDNIDYLENGFVKKKILTDSEVNEILSKLLLLKPDDNYAPNRKGASNYHCTFLDTNQDYKYATYALFKEYFNPIIENLFYNYQVWNGNFYVKPPGEGKFEIHQNWTHVKEEKDTSFTIWCPLVDTDNNNGTINLVRGSHKILPDIATMDVPYYFKNFEDQLLSKYLEPICCKAGECVIFEDGLIHFSDVNKSLMPRYALQILIGPKETNPVYYYIDNHSPELGFELFEINNDFFLKRNYKNYKDRPIDQKSIGFVKNKNKLLTENEFLLALEKGSDRRLGIYE